MKKESDDESDSMKSKLENEAKEDVKAEQKYDNWNVKVLKSELLSKIC